MKKLAKVRKTPVSMTLAGAQIGGKLSRAWIVQLGADNLSWGFKRCVQGFVESGVGKHEAVQGIIVVLPQKQQLRGCYKV